MSNKPASTKTIGEKVRKQIKRLNKSRMPVVIVSRPSRCSIHRLNTGRSGRNRNKSQNFDYAAGE